MNFDIDNALWCSVTLKDKGQHLIGIVYRSPSSSDNNNGRLYYPPSKVLTTLITFHFNVVEINWKDSNYLGSELS